jgi:small-conductance mechanosensitive channel
MQPLFPAIHEGKAMPSANLGISEWWNALLKAVADLWNAWGANYHRWLTAAGIALAVFIVLRMLRALFARNIARLTQGRPDSWLADAERLLQRTKTWFLLVMACCGGALGFGLSSRGQKAVALIAVTALLIQAAFWADALLAGTVSRLTSRRRETDAAGATTLTALGFLGRLAIWTAAVLWVMSNLGIDVTAMVAGLGIGGIAVALAAQNILGDLFASASIVLDRPFVIGDFIVVDDKKGVVEYIGLKTTRLRSLSGEQLVFSNTDLLKSRLHNYKRMSQRRATFTIDVTYDTPPDKVAAVPAMLREAVEAQPLARLDRAHFASFGQYSLIFEVVYYVLSSEYNVYMDVQQEVNLAILRRFAAEGIEFAFPTQTIHCRRADAEA